MLKIHKTTNYGLFNFLSSNREPAPKYLVESIQKKNLLEEHPIICDMNMNVIDGQNRLKAAEMLGVPIFYIVSENINEEDIGICQVQKPWLMSDFLRFYGDRDDYKFVHEMMQRFSLPIHFVVFGCHMKRSAYEDFRKGTFYVRKPKEELREKFHQISEIMALFMDNKRNASMSQVHISCKVQRSLWFFINQPDYDHKIMVHKIKTFPSNVTPLLDLNSEKSITEALDLRIYRFKETKPKGQKK